MPSNFTLETDEIINKENSTLHTSALDSPQLESYTTTKLQYLSYNFNVNMPSYRPDGDLYIAQIAMDGDEYLSSPSGWTVIENGYYDTYYSPNDVRFATYWRIGNSEPTTYRWSCGTQRLWIGAIYRISGFDPNNPIHTSNIGTGFSTYPRAPGITTTVDQCLILRMFGADNNYIYSTYWPFGTTPIFQDNCGSGSVMSAAAYHFQSTAGSLNYAQFRMSYSAGWVGISIAIAPLPDTIPPTFSDLVESADPLELGDTEVIRINTTDPSGINQVLLEFDGSNHSMSYISGDMWEYNSWTPTSVGDKSYTIWMEDTNNNWNSTTGSINVIDTTAPTYSDLIESADPLQLGDNETITIKAYDSPGSGVNQVLLEYEDDDLIYRNHTMNFIGANTWSWSNWKPSVGIHSYRVFIEDLRNNWNTTDIFNITVISTTAPLIGNLSENVDPLELGNYITISIEVVDGQTSVSAVLIKLENINYTMIYISGNTYEFNWTGALVGIVIYTIYANDTENNWNSLTSSFDIVDTTKPMFTAVTESQDLIELGDNVIISANATDLTGIKQAKIAYSGYNHTMGKNDDTWESDPWMPLSTGNYPYTIWIEDNNNNWNFTVGDITVQDTIAPAFSNLTESDDPIELGEDLLITIIVSDLSSIKRVTIEYEGSNHSMANIGGDLWQYDAWRPTLANNYSYVIYMEDNNKNYNFTTSSILFQDTISPVYSNLEKNAYPFLELGDTAIITIDIDDVGGINHALIEFEGLNHTMTNIYGNVWQYNSWVPNNWIVYQYTIYMEDLSGNSNFVIDNITVQDTTPPLAPFITNAPSGDVSGVLTFDWLDGSDPSGISYYILIIDNETNPFATPGFLYYYNISNVGSESSFFELTESLSQGKYYYFLYQIDGVGHQSEYTMGTFSIILVGDPNLMNFIIIVAVLASLVAIGSTIIIARKRMKKEIEPPREKIPLKVVLSHVTKISTLNATSVEKTIEKKKDKKKSGKSSNMSLSINEEMLNTRIDRIRAFGNELLAEGAYLEAQKQFEFAEKVLIKMGRKEDALEFSNLKITIKELAEEREKKLEQLELEKLGNNSLVVFELYNDVIELSHRLKDVDVADIYQSELIEDFQSNEQKLKDLEYQRFRLYQQANSLMIDKMFEKAVEIYDQCKKISQFFVKLGRINENKNIEKFDNLINDCLKKASQLNDNGSES